MCRRRDNMMLFVALYLAVLTSTVQARSFNITYLSVPEIVPPGQHEIEIECRYDANFTLLSWFKGSNEFFRYRPGTTPSTRSFPILGVGIVDLIICGPTACRLKLGELTEEATGLYRCDIERDVVPYMFATSSVYMEVHANEKRKPLLEGLAEEYGEGDLIQAYCRGGPNSQIRWYINGNEFEDLRGNVTLNKKSTRLIFVGLPPTLTVQCAELRAGKLYGSKESKARWNEVGHIRKNDKKMINSGCVIFHKFIYIVLCIIRYVFL